MLNVAFKEWAVVVDALARGEQIFILRKGGIHEGRGGFAVDHPEFLFFPTLFHQQRESVTPSAQDRFDLIAPGFPPAGTLRLTHWARVEEWLDIRSPDSLKALRGQHIWSDAVLRERFDWGKTKQIFALALRVYRLPAPVDLADATNYGGCKSWVELNSEVDPSGSEPVLDKGVFGAKLDRFRASLRAFA